MTTIVKRSVKGSKLTHNEVDSNFHNLNEDKLEKGAFDDESTIVIRNKDGNVVAKVIAEARIMGRLTGGDIEGLTVAQIKTLLAYAIADIPDLQDDLDDKADATHTHAIADVTDLQDTLDTFDADLGTAESDISNLQTNKADLSLLNGLSVFAKGSDTLAAGEKVVLVPLMLATDRVVVGHLTAAGTPGALYTNGSESGGFTCKSTNAGDNSTFFYIILR